jgi:hypothetical protein
MSNEEMNKKMEFIVEHQAKFAAEMEVIREVQAADAKLLKDGLIAVVDIVGALARAQERSEASIQLLTESQARTDERLNNLISVVERHISGNGGSHSHA